ncbi:MAG: hypothetical protein IT436_02360 [Phycisphaerales bacterium]|nr:hypothetical protein [Phycisphaerales bacterium]
MTVAALSAAVPCLAQEAAKPAAEAAQPPSGMAPDARFALSDERGADTKVLWDGFLNGLRGFEQFYNPVGNPLYFETPFNNSELRFLYLHHDFPDDSVLQGGDVNVYAMQARLALTERLGFIATKDGISHMDADALPEDSGWNDLAAGLKYVFYVDRDTDLVATAGARYMFDSGDDGVLQSGVQELSPFLSVAKGFDRLHFIGDITDRIPFDGDDGNNVLQWDIHGDYEVLPGFAPMLELHGLHYLNDGERTPLPVGGADYANLGSTDVDGSTVIWLGVGARVKLNPHTSIGATFEYPLTNRDADIFADRFTIDFILAW